MPRTIYEPKGKALEYAPLAVNLYKGCSHRCSYCYAPRATYSDRDSFYYNPEPRKNILAKIEKEAKELAGDKRPVLLCFTCDCFQPINDVHGLAEGAIDILNRHDIAVHVLTKGAARAMEAFDLLAKHPRNTYAVTLTFDDEKISKEWEPDADSPAVRMQSLQKAHDMGITTWVSFEPVIEPAAVLRLIDMTHDVVDLYKVGKWNYDARAKEIDWVRFRKRVVERLEKVGKRYLIKKDLKEAT